MRLWRLLPPRHQSLLHSQRLLLQPYRHRLQMQGPRPRSKLLRQLLRLPQGHLHGASLCRRRDLARSTRRLRLHPEPHSADVPSSSAHALKHLALQVHAPAPWHRAPGAPCIRHAPSPVAPAAQAVLRAVLALRPVAHVPALEPVRDSVPVRVDPAELRA